MIEVINIISSTGMNKAVYNKNTQQLDIFFNKGKIYSYYKVPENIWLDFKLSKSKGSYFSKFIKGKYLLNNK